MMWDSSGLIFRAILSAAVPNLRQHWKITSIAGLYIHRNFGREGNSCQTRCICNYWHAARGSSFCFVLFLLRCATIRCDTLRCDTLRYAAIRCAALRYAAIRCDTLRYDAIRCATMRFDALRWATMRYDALRCATMRYDALWCATMRYAGLRCAKMRWDALHYTLHYSDATLMLLVALGYSTLLCFFFLGGVFFAFVRHNCFTWSRWLQRYAPQFHGKIWPKKFWIKKF
jgi:hypothetical protein